MQTPESVAGALEAAGGGFTPTEARALHAYFIERERRAEPRRVSMYTYQAYTHENTHTHIHTYTHTHKHTHTHTHNRTHTRTHLYTRTHTH